MDLNEDVSAAFLKISPWIPVKLFRTKFIKNKLLLTLLFWSIHPKYSKKTFIKVKWNLCKVAATLSRRDSRRIYIILLKQSCNRSICIFKLLLRLRLLLTTSSLRLLSPRVTNGFSLTNYTFLKTNQIFFQKLSKEAVFPGLYNCRVKSQK